jgi:hypothetical protein
VQEARRVQWHASYDPVFGSSVPEGYFGVTNAVRYQT